MDCRQCPRQDMTLKLLCPVDREKQLVQLLATSRIEHRNVRDAALQMVIEVFDLIAVLC